jgi:hypothetical protein
MDDPFPSSGGASRRAYIYFDDDFIENQTPSTESGNQARLARWQATVGRMAEIVDESDTDELWDEVLRNLGVDPKTGGGLDS